MSLTLSQLLAEAGDQMRCVAGFSGLEKPVLASNKIDSPEIITWLKAGELVMTTGYVLSQNPEMLRTIVPDLHKKGCVGLAFKAKRYFDEIPAVILEQGNTLHFPILELSYEMTLSDLAHIVYSSLYAGELSAVEQTYHVYSRVAKSALSDMDTGHCLYEVARHIPNPVFLLDSELRLIAYETPNELAFDMADYVHIQPAAPFLPPAEAGHILAHYRDTRFRQHSHVLRRSKGNLTLTLFPMEASRENLGFLGFLEAASPLNIEQYRTIEDLLPILAIHVMKKSLYGSFDLEKRENFVDNVLKNPAASEEAIRRYCRAYQFDFTQKRLCLVLEVNGYLALTFSQKNALQSSLTQTARQLMEGRGLAVFLTFNQNQLVCFMQFDVSVRDIDAVQTAQQAAKALLEQLGQGDEAGGFTLGLGGPSVALRAIPQSYKQALAALELGRRIHPGRQMHAYTEDIAYHFLHECASYGQLEELYRSTLAPLEEADPKHGADLAHTLSVYFENDQKRPQTAEALGIHRNTLIYRLDKIKEILHIDFERANDRLRVQLGLCVKKMLETGELLGKEV